MRITTIGTCTCTHVEWGVAIPGRIDRTVKIFPWTQSNPEVYLEITESDDSNFQNIIVNREEFVEGLLAVFPELSRSNE